MHNAMLTKIETDLCSGAYGIGPAVHGPCSASSCSRAVHLILRARPAALRRRLIAGGDR